MPKRGSMHRTSRKPIKRLRQALNVVISAMDMRELRRFEDYLNDRDARDAGTLSVADFNSKWKTYEDGTT